MNKVILLGRLTKDPELKHTPSGSAVCNFSIATNEKYKDKSGQKQEVVEFHNIVVWSKQAESCEKYLSKGSQVLIEGKIKSRSYDDKEGNKKYVTDIVASSVQFIGSSKTETSQNSFDKPIKQSTNEQIAKVKQEFDIQDEIPF